MHIIIFTQKRQIKVSFYSVGRYGYIYRKTHSAMLALCLYPAVNVSFTLSGDPHSSFWCIDVWLPRMWSENTFLTTVSIFQSLKVSVQSCVHRYRNMLMFGLANVYPMRFRTHSCTITKVCGGGRWVVKEAKGILGNMMEISRINPLNCGLWPFLNAFCVTVQYGISLRRLPAVCREHIQSPAQ